MGLFFEKREKREKEKEKGEKEEEGRESVPWNEAAISFEGFVRNEKEKILRSAPFGGYDRAMRNLKRVSLWARYIRYNALFV